MKPDALDRVTPDLPLVLVLARDPDAHAALAAALEPGCCVLSIRESSIKDLPPHPGGVGVVVLDDGAGARGIIALFQRVRLKWPHVRAVALLSSRDPAVIGALDTLVGALLVRPFPPERLLSLVRHQVRISSMSSGVRQLRDASAVRRLPGDDGRPAAGDQPEDPPEGARGTPRTTK